MRLVVEGTFDMGMTFGLSRRNARSLFAQPEKLKALSAVFGSSCTLFSEPAASVSDDNDDDDDYSHFPQGAKSPFGFGLRVLLPAGGEFATLLVDNATEFLRQQRASLEKEFGVPAVEEAERLIQNSRLVRRAVLFVFELGLGALRIHLDLPEKTSARAVLAVFKCFENAGYGEDLKGKTANAQVAEFRRNVVEIFGSRSSPVALLCSSELAEGNVDFPGFQGVLFADSLDSLGDAPDEMFRRGDLRHEFAWGNMHVTATWLIKRVTGEAGHELNRMRLLHSTLCLQVSWQACSVFEKIFNERMMDSMESSLSIVANSRPETLSRRQLNHIRQFATYVISVTSIEALSDYAGDLRLGEFYEVYAKIGQRHHRISATSLALQQVEQEVQASDEAEEQEYQNNLLLVMTIVSLVGISSGVIGSWEQGMNLLENHILFVVVLILPSLVTSIIVAWRKFTKK